MTTRLNCRKKHRVINNTEKKHCYLCGKWKTLDEFYNSQVSWDGRGSRCKICELKYQKVYRKNNTVAIKTRKRKHYHQHKERILAEMKIYRNENSKKIRKRKRLEYLKSKEHVSKRGKTYRRNNVSKIKKYNNGPASYEIYAKQVAYAEKIRRCPQNREKLEVACAYCGRYFMPKIKELKQRIRALKGSAHRTGEARLYCSNDCKRLCPIFNQSKYPRDFIVDNSREVQPELRQLVFQRDDYECQKCGETESLHCHHITGVEQDPLLSADVDNCVTLCEFCHINVHKQKGCTYQDLKRCA